MADRHPCVAHACTAPLPGSLVMCRRHWRMIPAPLRDRLNAAYAAGQTGATASEEYVRALAEAVDAVRQVDLLHPCPIDGRLIPANAVVCRSCWRLLPPGLRRSVRNLRTAPGVQVPDARVAHVLADAARAVRAAKEGR